MIIVSLIPAYNRQGRDLFAYLCRQGRDPWLVQYGDCDERELHKLAVRYIRPCGVFSKFYVLRHILLGVRKILSCGRSDVIAINGVSLFAGVLCKLIRRRRLVYYSLEYSTPSPMMRWIMRHCVDVYVDVEENRRQRFLRECGATIPKCVVNNMPLQGAAKMNGGRLRAFLAKDYPLLRNRKIVIYAGSFQRYARLPLLIKVAGECAGQLALVLMTYNLPEDLKRCLPSNVFLAPCVADGFYDWLSDADLALLPYEDPSDFNVLNCSPQKLFDCYACGVPYLASARPLIKKTLSVYPSAGRLVDFTDAGMLKEMLQHSLDLKTEACSSAMKALFATQFHYEAQADKLMSLLAGR